MAALVYVGWCGYNGRLMAGPVGLLHPVGDYWFDKPAAVSCFIAEEGASEISLQVLANPNVQTERIGRPVVQQVTDSRISISLHRSVKAVRVHNATSNARLVVVAVPLDRGYTGQAVEVSSKHIVPCSQA